jgi:MFS family permease
VYATRAGFGVSGASQFVVAALLGGVVGQIPLGNWSDRTDRRIVMAVASGIGLAGAAIGVVATTANSLPGVLLAAVLLGAGAFSLYGLSLAHQADYTSPMHMLSAGSRFLTINGFGAAAGPITASVTIGLVGPEGMFHVLGAALTLFGAFVFVRMFSREAVDEDHRATYTPITIGATVAGLDGVLSETTGVESAVVRRRLALLRRRGPSARPPS